MIPIFAYPWFRWRSYCAPRHNLSHSILYVRSNQRLWSIHIELLFTSIRLARPSCAKTDQFRLFLFPERLALPSSAHYGPFELVGSSVDQRSKIVYEYSQWFEGKTVSSRTRDHLHWEENTEWEGKCRADIAHRLSHSPKKTPCMRRKEV